jgi:hypothetical protein
MVTETITTTAASVIVQPDAPPANPSTTQTTTMASQRIASCLQTILRRTPGGPGGPGGAGNPGGPREPEGGPGGPGGPPPAENAPAAPAVTAPANNDDRLMGSLPQPYEGDRKFARTFLDQLVHYSKGNKLQHGFEIWGPGSTP